MSIWTTPERDDLRKTVRAFVEREVAPHAAEWERIGELPWVRSAAAAALFNREPSLSAKGAIPPQANSRRRVNNAPTVNGCWRR